MTWTAIAAGSAALFLGQLILLSADKSARYVWWSPILAIGGFGTTVFLTVLNAGAGR